MVQRVLAKELFLVVNPERLSGVTQHPNDKVPGGRCRQDEADMVRYPPQAGTELGNKRRRRRAGAVRNLASLEGLATALNALDWRHLVPVNTRVLAAVS